MVTVYIKPNHALSNETCTALEQHGIAYRQVDLSADPAALAHVKELGYLQTPVVETDCEHWSGHHPQKIAEYAAH